MRISELRGYHVSARLPAPRGSARGFFDRRDALIIEIVAEDGLSGWGECWSAPAASAAIMRSRLAALILGRDGSRIDALWDAMRGAVGADPLGAGSAAIAALDMALHDLTARARGVPVSALLGAAVRDRVPAYASGPFMKPGGDPYRGYAADVEGYLKLGFRAIKPRAGIGPRADAAMGAALRRQVGAEVALMVDVNQGYEAADAIAAARGLADSDFRWIEEPVGPADVAGYRAVARAGGMAVAGGEALSEAAAFGDFLAADALAVLQPDLAVCGGFTGVAAVLALAEAADRPVVPHVWGTVVSFYASLQLAAVLPPRAEGSESLYPFLEFERSGYPLLNLFGDPPLNADGTISIPTTPGIGVELAAETLAPWVVESWVETA